MKFLLDTCVISELVKPNGNSAVQKTLAAIEGEKLFISALTIGELVKGIFLLPHTSKRKRLSDWLQQIETSFATQLLPFDRDTAVIWGEMNVHGTRHGRTVPVIDGMIAATAIQHGLHIMTRNVKDFEGSGAPIIDPWLSSK